MALSGWRPTVTVTTQAGFNRAGQAVTSVLTGKRNDAVPKLCKAVRWQLQATQPIYRGGRTEAATKRAINTVQAARAQTFSVETDVFTAVVTAFLDVVRDQNLLEVARNNEQVLRRQLEATRDRFRVGEVTRTDVAQAEAALAQAIAQRITAEGNLEISRSLYTRAVGHPPERLVMPVRAPGPAGDAGRSAGACRDQQFQRDLGDVYRSRRARQCRFRSAASCCRRFRSVGSIGRSIAPSVSQFDARTDTGVGGRPDDRTALRSRQCLCADEAGGADRRATAQPGRYRAPLLGAARGAKLGEAAGRARLDRVVCCRRCGQPRSRWRVRSRKRLSARARCSTF